MDFCSIPWTRFCLCSKSHLRKRKSTVIVCLICLDDDDLSSWKIPANFSKSLRRAEVIKRGLICEILRAGALAHSIRVDQVDIEWEEIAPNVGIKRCSSKEKILAIIKPKCLFDICVNNGLSDFEGQAYGLLSIFLDRPLRANALCPGRCIK